MAIFVGRGVIWETVSFDRGVALTEWTVGSGPGMTGLRHDMWNEGAVLW